MFPLIHFWEGLRAGSAGTRSVPINARVAPAGGAFYAGASTVTFDLAVNLKTARAINLKIPDAFCSAPMS